MEWCLIKHREEKCTFLPSCSIIEISFMDFSKFITIAKEVVKTHPVHDYVEFIRRNYDVLTSIIVTRNENVDTVIKLRDFL
jgi:hypothetical protein